MFKVENEFSFLHLPFIPFSSFIACTNLIIIARRSHTSNASHYVTSFVKNFVGRSIFFSLVVPCAPGVVRYRYLKWNPIIISAFLLICYFLFKNTTKAARKIQKNAQAYWFLSYLYGKWTDLHRNCGIGAHLYGAESTLLKDTKIFCCWIYCADYRLHLIKN